MIRQAHSYMAGAVSGAALIATAIVIFVVLVAAQVFKDWPVPNLGLEAGDDASVSISPGHPVAQPGGAGPAAAGVPAGATGAGGRAAQPPGTLTQASGGDSEAPTSPSGNSNQGSGAASAPVAAADASTGSGSPSSEGGGNSSSPSATITGTVNDTASQVDHSALGGDLHDSGVTDVTQGVVNGVAGPNSAVGQTVDKAAGTVGGLLDNHH